MTWVRVLLHNKILFRRTNLFAVKKDGKYMCHKGHYSVDKPYLSNNVHEARVFKTIQACKNSRFKILVISDEWLAYKAALNCKGRPATESRIHLPKYYDNKKLKPGYSIVEIGLVELQQVLP